MLGDPIPLHACASEKRDGFCRFIVCYQKIWIWALLQITSKKTFKQIEIELVKFCNLQFGAYCQAWRETFLWWSGMWNSLVQSGQVLLRHSTSLELVSQSLSVTSVRATLEDCLFWVCIPPLHLLATLANSIQEMKRYALSDMKSPLHAIKLKVILGNWHVWIGGEPSFLGISSVNNGSIQITVGQIYAKRDDIIFRVERGLLVGKCMFLTSTQLRCSFS